MKNKSVARERKSKVFKRFESFFCLVDNFENIGLFSVEKVKIVIFYPYLVGKNRKDPKCRVYNRQYFSKEDIPRLWKTFWIVFVKDISNIVFNRLLKK